MWEPNSTPAECMNRISGAESMGAGSYPAEESKDESPPTAPLTMKTVALKP